jgi:urocanate hydratase
MGAAPARSSGARCDGSEHADRQFERVRWKDPAKGMMRHADGGYDVSLDCAPVLGLNLPRILGRR